MSDLITKYKLQLMAKAKMEPYRNVESGTVLYQPTLDKFFISTDRVDCIFDFQCHVLLDDCRNESPFPQREWYRVSDETLVDTRFYEVAKNLTEFFRNVTEFQAIEL